MTSSEPLPTPEPRAASRNLADHIARRRQAAIAGHTDDGPTARRLLDDPDPGVRATALRALARLGDLRADELERSRDDADPGVRRSVAEVLATWEPPDPDDLVALLPLLADRDATVVETAAWAAGERMGRATDAGGPLPEPAALDALIGLVRTHDDALCREAAVASLGAIGDERGLPAILAATTDKATVRRRAIIALAPFDGPEVDAALEKARTDRDWQVRQAAEDLLADD